MQQNGTVSVDNGFMEWTEEFVVLLGMIYDNNYG